MRVRYTLLVLAVLLAATVEWLRGYKLMIVLPGAAAFLLAGCFVVYRSDARARAERRRQHLDYWTN